MERNDMPESFDDRAQLTTFLNHARATVVWKCEGIGEELAHATPFPASPLMSIASVVNHLRWDENGWFSVNLLGDADHTPSTEEDPDGEFRIAANMPLAQIIADYEAECARSNAAIASLPLETPLKYTRRNGFRPDLRWTILHMIDETARHNGHLDILRETADGAKGY